jgi:hypothetical protein
MHQQLCLFDASTDCTEGIETVIQKRMHSDEETMAVEPVAVPMTPDTHSDIEKITTDDEDARKLQALGHKQELRRNFSTYSIAAMGFVNGKYVMTGLSKIEKDW